MIDQKRRDLIGRTADRFASTFSAGGSDSAGWSKSDDLSYAIKAIKGALVIWGIVSAFQGIFLDLVADEHARLTSLESPFIGLVYFSVLCVGSFGFASSRVTAIALGVISLMAFGVLLAAGSAPHSLGLDLSSEAAYSAIVLRPVAASLILFIVSRVEHDDRRRRERVTQ